jgi:alanine racemase
LAALAQRIAADPHVELEGLGTHFADIEDTTDHAFAAGQIQRFGDAAEEVSKSSGLAPLRHTACSAAAILFAETHLDIVRIGISLYGLWPSTATYVSARERGLGDFHLTPALTWKTVVAQLKDVPEGGFVGYGRTWRASRPSRIAVLPVGYYEGYNRSLSGRAHVLVRGRRAPVVGRICMNMTMVDVTDVRGVAQGDTVVLIGRDGEEELPAAQLGDWAGTIHYEIVSRVHPSLPRVPV